MSPCCRAHGLLDRLFLEHSKAGMDPLPFQRAYQHTSHPRAITAAWRDKVLYMNATKKKVQLTDTFFNGIFLGVEDGSEELIIGTPSGCWVCRTIVPDDEVIGEPVEPKLCIDVLPVNTDLLLPINTEPSKPRRVHIRNSIELARHRYTLGCLGCEAAVNAIPGSSRYHSCRLMHCH